MHPLISRLLTDLNWPHLNTPDTLDQALAAPGLLCLFVPGDAARNLETPDAAVILPELRQAFQNRFACAVVGDAVETGFREAHKVFKTPAYAFFENGRLLGAIQKVRDWDDYIARTAQILSQTQAA